MMSERFDVSVSHKYIYEHVYLRYALASRYGNFVIDRVNIVETTVFHFFCTADFRLFILHTYTLPNKNTYCFLRMIV